MANHGLKLATLCYVQRPGQTLMLHRVKRANDYHEGKWNGLGGKFEQGESPEECVAREVYEESGLVCVDPALRGQITFPNFDGQADWYVWLFLAQHWTGQLRESPEGSLAWIDNDRLLDLNLWPGDRLFIPMDVRGSLLFRQSSSTTTATSRATRPPFTAQAGASTARVTSIRRRSPRPISSLSTSRLTTPTAGCATAR